MNRSHSELWAQFAAAGLAFGCPTSFYQDDHGGPAGRAARMADELVAEWIKRFESEPRDA